LREGINEPKEIVTDGINIQNNLVRCVIINKISQIFCYFFKEEYREIFISDYYLSLANFYIEDMNINLNQTYNFQTNDAINQIKIVLSSNNNFFIYITLDPFYNSYSYINNGKSNNFEKGNCTMDSLLDSNYGIFYFNSTDDFMLVSRKYKSTTLINNFSKEVKICLQNKLKFNEGDFHFSIIYHDTINNYILISNPTFYSFNKCNNVKILYEFQNKYYPECPSQISFTSNEIPYFCEAKCSKEEPFEIFKEQQCTNFCGINSIFNQECKIKYKENDNNNENILLNNIKKDIITSNFDKQDLYNNKDIVIQEQYTKFIITTYKKII